MTNVFVNVFNTCITRDSSDHVRLILLAHVDGVDDAVSLGDFTSMVYLSHIFYVFSSNQVSCSADEVLEVCEEQLGYTLRLEREEGG